jgi:predicted DNA-binding transcriptional regulator YafY
MTADTIKDKQARLHRLSHLLYRHPHGLTAREMAQMCGVTPRTIQRDIKALEEAEVPIYYDDDVEVPRYTIIKGYFLPPLRLTLNDAAALYLAARLLVRNTDDYNPHISTALHQLASVLPDSMGNALQLSVDQLAKSKPDPDARHVFEVLTLAWATSREVNIRYQSLKRAKQSTYTLQPYFVEPGERGNSYVVGFVKEREQVMTFKLDRIRHADLLASTFEFPDNYYPSHVFAHSWGVVFGDDLEEIVLRFAPSVALRVDETKWHPSQKVEETEDGGRLMRMKISGLLEIEPWIKTWGAAVEVLAPASLREKFVQEAKQLAGMYSV